MEILEATKREKILESAQFKCEICGEPAEHVHHKDKNRQNDEPNNLMVLCRPCHVEQHLRLAFTISCPRCRSFFTYILKDGTRVCRKCGHREKPKEE